MTRIMSAFAGWVVRHRLLVILLTSALTIAGGFSIIKWSTIESDISKYLPQDDPVVVRFTEAGELFGGVAIGMVGVEFDDVFSVEALRLIDTLSRETRKVPGVGWVVSLTAVDDVQERNVDGEKAVVVNKLVDPDSLPSTPDELSRLRQYVLGKEQMVGLVVSQDARIANIAFGIDKDADRVQVANEVENRLRPLVTGHSVFFAGFPYWMKAMSEVILRDMVRLVPFVTLVVILILFLSFRTLRGVLLPLLTVVVSSIWAMGLMAAVGIPITMLSNVIPVLLIALGTAYAIHLLHKVNELESDGGAGGAGRQDSLRAALVDVMIPIGMAGLTTAIGFLSFLTSDLLFIQHTGLIAAFGIFAAMLVALTLLPAILSMLRHQRPRFDYSGHTLQGLARAVDGFGMGVLRHRRLVLLVTLAIALTAGAFIPRVDRQFNMIAYFPENSEVRKADDLMREKLGGNVPIWITVDGNPKHPFVLSTMRLLEKYLRSFPDVDNARSIASLVAEMNKIMTGHLAVPDTTEGIGNLWMNLEGKEVLDQLVSRDHLHALVQAASSSSDTARLRQIVAETELFLSTIPRNALPIDRHSASGEDLDKARDFLVDRAALEIELDLSYRVPDAHLTRQAIRIWLLDGMTASKLHQPESAYADRIRPWLSSDEADLEIENESVREKVTAAVAAAAATGTGDPEGLMELLRREIPAELFEQDRESLRYLAKSLSLLIIEVDDQSRAAGLRESILTHLPAPVHTSKTLTDDLDGDLYQLNARWVYLPVVDSACTADSGNTVTATVSLDLHQTGMHYISVNVDNRLVYSQLSSLGLAAILAMILLMIQFRSVVAGLLGMVPMTLTILVNFGVMGCARIDLEPATVLIASLVVGVGIDYTIHFMARAQLELARQGASATALDVTLRTAGRAILINAITVTGGQLVFLAGELIPLHTFGILLSLAMVVSALSSVSVLPAMLMVLQPRFLRSSKASSSP